MDVLEHDGSLGGLHEAIENRVSEQYIDNPKSNGTPSDIDKHTLDVLRRTTVISGGLDVIHKKTNKPYIYFGDVIDCTNSANDRPMALYMNDKRELFVRECTEFHAKFEKKEP